MSVSEEVQATVNEIEQLAAKIANDAADLTQEAAKTVIADVAKAADVITAALRRVADQL